ncbi:MAG TPA: glycosyltransferase [Vicinamibacterales bacterium]|nr:glycosyltransferase [Vicinamibacterales bacterium]
MPPEVSIVIPVLNKLEFTRQCLDRIWRHSGEAIPYEVVVVDNGSTDGTADWFADLTRFPKPVRYLRHATNLGFAKGNNAGARLAQGRWLLFLNNDTLPQPGWLSEMVRVGQSDPAVGIVGIKQLFPYTNTIYHTGIVFTSESRPEHLYPHLDASLPQVNQQREYQAVTGACLLIDRSLFEDCGGFDEAYLNGYEDIDLCLAVGQRGRKIVCCTSAYIYHYGQISEGRTNDDDANAALFARKWSGQVRADREEYLIRDRALGGSPARQDGPHVRTLANDCIYFADDLEPGSALTWINAELALALHERGVPVFINDSALREPTLTAETKRRLSPSALAGKPVGGTQLKWSHYRPGHLHLELTGRVNLEFFVINYLFGAPGSEPWDFWLQCLRQNHHGKLPLSEFCKAVLAQIGVPEADCHVWHPGYSREIVRIERPKRKNSRFRFLTVTNSHDLERYNTRAIIRAYRQSFNERDDVTLIIKDYGATSGDATIRRWLAENPTGAPIEYLADFTDKKTLIELYKSCDAFVSAHRGEGFGMKILDAMACGLPVVTPLFGGPTAYCNSENSFAVGFSLIPMGECLDHRSLRITNQPTWAEVDLQSLSQQMRRVYEDRDAASTMGEAGRSTVKERFSWDAAAARLVEIAEAVRLEPTSTAPPRTARPRGSAERSPYWLGLRVSVIVPTRDRKEKLLACLDALGRQSILPQEFEVIVVDDGSSDGTKEAIEARTVPFARRYLRQERAGPGAARNLGLQHAEGELVLFIGDDIVADERLLEEHLLAHAVYAEPGTAVLGRIDWPDNMPRNAVMEYVCGDAALQFAYTVIPHLPSLDHRFFYTSNISLRRQFLLDAANAGVRFDPCFRHAAFEDSEFAFRLMPRGLRIRYAEGARAAHDHLMDLDSFARREFSAGEMAVIFYRKHPGQDDQLQVQWIADLVEPAAALRAEPELLRHLEAFDVQSDALLRALAGSLEALLAMSRQPGSSTSGSLSTDRLHAALGRVLRVIFDVQRTRGKLQEWFSSVDDAEKTRAAQTLAGVRRKIEFLNLDAGPLGTLPTIVAPPDGRAAADARASLPLTRRARQRLRQVIVSPSILPRLIAVDRLVEARLQSAATPDWVAKYRSVRRRIRALLA